MHSPVHTVLVPSHSLICWCVKCSNISAETVAQKPVFSRLLDKKRCAVILQVVSQSSSDSKHIGGYLHHTQYNTDKLCAGLLRMEDRKLQKIALLCNYSLYLAILFIVVKHPHLMLLCQLHAAKDNIMTLAG